MASVEQLKAQRAEAKRQFNRYAKRRDAVRRVIRSAENVNEDWRTLEQNIRNLGDDVEETMRQMTPDEPQAVFFGLSEPLWTQRSGVGESIECLRAEEAACQKKINEYDALARRLKVQIEEAGGTVYFWE